MIMTFPEYLARVQAVLADPVEMMAKVGVSKDVPHEIEVMRLTKAMKRAAERAAHGRTSPGRDGTKSSRARATTC